ncbi:nucleotidyltransferase domain-containing protein [Candidatus Woesearchaeota archaeon]|nr:nucleotidyltransferase domain-containing protein [Candidatus Woesearchaeota archaeon]
MMLDERRKILKKIKLELNKIFGEEITCAFAYGSTLCEDFNPYSDFDILIFFKSNSFHKLNILRNIKERYSKSGINIDFNVHLLNESPKIRKRAFWHNNRAYYLQKEICLYGQHLLGENLFCEPSYLKEDSLLESVRVINSLLYQTRKMLINRVINKDEKIRLMKFCIYGTLYALASKEIYPKSKKDAMKIFNKNFSLKINPNKFLNFKRNPNRIKQRDIRLAYKFLTSLDKAVYKNYEEAIKNGIQSSK